MIRQRNTEQTGTNIHRIIRNSGERNHQAIKLNKNRKTHIRKLRKKDRGQTWRTGQEASRRRPFRDPWWSRDLGQPWRIRLRGRVPSPPSSTAGALLQVYKKILGESRGYPRALGGALEVRTLRGALKARTLGGALEARTLGGALEWPEDAWRDAGGGRSGGVDS